MQRRKGQLFHFTWWVQAGGYRWEAAEEVGWDGAPRLSLNPAARQRGERSYSPLQEHPGLFLELAETKRTPEGLLAFADRFGGLFAADGRPEDFHEWCAHSDKLATAVRLWRMVRDGDTAGLSRHIVWGRDLEEGQPEVYYTPGPGEVDLGRLGRSTIASARMAGGWLEHFRPGDLVLPAMVFVRGLVNRRLDECVAPRLNYDPAAAGDNPTRMVLDLEPKSLLGAVWLQLAQAIDGNRKYLRCGGCGQWFACGLNARADKLYCTDACRARAYRERPGRAGRMRAEGKTLKEIATILNADEAQVKAWLRNPRKKEK